MSTVIQLLAAFIAALPPKWIAELFEQLKTKVVNAPPVNSRDRALYDALRMYQSHRSATGQAGDADAGRDDGRVD